MSISTVSGYSDNYPQDVTHSTPDTGATTGTGGGDMLIFTQTRHDKLRSLVTASYTNNSAYTLPKGVVDTVRYQDFEEQEKSNTEPPVEPETGSGGGDMLIYSKPRQDQLRSLVLASYTNNSAYSLPKGVVDTVRYQDFEEQEKSPAEPPAEPETGSGGGDMLIYSRPRQDQLRSLVTSSYTNNSAYSLPGGVVNTVRYQNFEGEEVSPAEPPAEPETGSGGGIMQIWYTDRIYKLNTLARGYYVNQSSFALPAGVVDTGGYRSYEGNEKGIGYSAEGQVIAPNGLALSGTLSVIGDGEEIDGAAISGSFIASFPPFEGVASGSGGAGVPDQIDLRFTPTADGLASTSVGVNYPRADGFNVTYGYLGGRVYDYAGNPLSEVPVQGDGTGTVTDSEGFYYLLAPGERAATLTSLDGTVQKNATAKGGDTVTVDWQYGGISVRVVGPELKPVPNAPVTVNGENLRTNSAGEVVVPDVPPGTHDVTIMDQFEKQLEILDEGQLVKHTFEGGSRITIQCFDGTSGDSIAELPAIDVNSQTISFSSSDGEVSVLALGEGEYDILLSEGDNRYLNSRLTGELERGSVESTELLLQRKAGVTNV